MSIDFKLNRDQAILLALELCGAKDLDQPITSSQLQQGVRMLQSMLKAWSADGLHLWTMTNGVIFPVQKKQCYLLGDGGDHASLLKHTVFAELDGNQEAGSDFDLVSAEGISVGDTIGITVINSGAFTGPLILDEGDFFFMDDGGQLILVTDEEIGSAGTHLEWFTVTAVNADIVSIDGSTTFAVPAGGAVYAYSQAMERPLRIHSARRRLDGVEVPLNKYAREDYERLTLKTTEGATTQFYYSPQIGLGEFSPWPLPSGTDQTIIITFERTIKNVDENDDDFDIPHEWTESIAYNLAVRLATVYQAPAETYQILKMEAEQKKAELLAWDQELPSVQITPAWRY